MFRLLALVLAIAALSQEPAPIVNPWATSRPSGRDVRALLDEGARSRPNPFVTTTRPTIPDIDAELERIAWEQQRLTERTLSLLAAKRRLLGR